VSTVVRSKETFLTKTTIGYEFVYLTECSAHV